MKKIFFWMKKHRALILIGLFLFCAAAFTLFQYRTNFHWYHLAYVNLVRDRSDDIAMLEEDFINFPESVAAQSQTYRLKWMFRPKARIYSEGWFCSDVRVDDSDKDGDPEVYWTSYSRSVYCVDGKTGKKVWRYELPFGVTGAITLKLEDVDNDSRKEIICGTHWTLPIRAYCLSTEKNITDRILWAVNVHGDFIEGGISTCKMANGESRIIVASRDAPYSRGSLNILNGKGKYVVPAITGLDVCAGSPGLGDIDGDGENDMLIHGSHNFYNAKYGWKIVARGIKDGKLLWINDVKRDTGYQQHFIADINFDGKKEVVIYPDPCQTNSYNSIILNPLNGEEIDRIPGTVMAFFQTPAGEPYLLYQEAFINETREQRSFCINARTKELIYEMVSPPYKHVLDLDLDGAPEILCEDYYDNKLTLVIFGALTGKKESEYFLEHNLEQLNKPKFFYDFASVLTDCDNDGYWEFITKINDYICAFDLPYPISR